MAKKGRPRLAEGAKKTKLTIAVTEEERNMLYVIGAAYNTSISAYLGDCARRDYKKALKKIEQWGKSVQVPGQVTIEEVLGGHSQTPLK